MKNKAFFKSLAIKIDNGYQTKLKFMHQTNFY